MGLLAAIGLGLVASLVAVAVFVLGATPSSLPSGARAGGLGVGAPGGLAKDGVARAYAKLPLAFEPNRGQTDSRVRFLARGAGYSLFLTPGEAVLSLTGPQARARAPGLGVLKPSVSGQSTTAALRMRMLGANPAPELAPAERLPGHSNYMTGSDQTGWRSGVPHYAKVRYQGVYPGVDVVYYGDQGRLEYDFELAAGADPHAIALAFAGTKRLRVDARGDLLLDTAAGTVRQHKPVAYQRRGGRRQAVKSRYVLTGDRRVSISLGAYDRTKPLVIDPVLEYSTYLGGTGEDYGNAIAVDASGSAYVTGETSSTDFPTKNPLYPTPKGVFVTKFNPAGSALDYSTYLGGTGINRGNGIAVDGSGSAYVVGRTNSTDFPTKNAFDSSGPLPGVAGRPNGGDAFLAKLNPSGSGLDYSTYLGGDAGGITYGADRAQDVAVDAGGRAYVVGGTEAVDFPTKNAFDPVLGGAVDMFVAKLDPGKSGADSLVYSTYLGGSSGAETAGGIAVDASGSAYATGASSADDYPTKNAFQALRAPGPCPPFGCLDVVVTKFEPAGNELDYSTYLGGTSHDTGRDVGVEPSGAAYVTGDTGSADDPAATPPTGGYPTTVGAFQRQLSVGPGTDAFVTKLTAAGSALAYSTYLGGFQLPGDDSSSGYDHGNGIAADSCGSAYVTGQTTSRNFPTKDAVQGAYGGDDAPSPGPVFPADDVFITKLNSAGSALEYSTYLGGKAQELQGYSQGIAVNPSTGTAYVTGRTFLYTGTNDFPTRNAFQPAFAAPPSGSGASSDAFVAALSAPFTPCAAPVGLPAVSVTDVSVSEGDSGQANATFTLLLSVSPAQPLSVSYATADGSAKAPEDYVSAGGSVGFGAGETNKTVTVAVQSDRVAEADERFFVNLASPQNATVADGQGVGTIVDDDSSAGGGGSQPGGQPGGGQTGAGSAAGGDSRALLPGRCANERRGTDASEVLEGTPAGDRLLGLGGNDRIAGLKDDDCLWGGAGLDNLTGAEGDDELLGEAGKDRISGGLGNDVLRGGTGKDVLNGGFHDDRLIGGASNDKLAGGRGDDRVFGGSGNDRLAGGDGNDRLAGGKGNDKLRAGQGRNSLAAGSGKDSIVAVNGRRDHIDCGPGRDRVRADRTDRLRSCEQQRIAR